MSNFGYQVLGFGINVNPAADEGGSTAYGQQLFTADGSWTAPVGVTSVCVVCV